MYINELTLLLAYFVSHPERITSRPQYIIHFGVFPSFLHCSLLSPPKAELLMFAESVRKFLPNFPLSTPQSDKSSARKKPDPNKLDDLLKSLKRLIIFHFSPFNLTSQRLRRLHSGNGQGKKLDFFSQIPFSCELAFLRAGIA